MDRWKSHKIVEAGKVASVTENPDTQKLDFSLASGEIVEDPNFDCQGIPGVGDYLVKSDHGYWSWEPAKAFDEEFSLADPVGAGDS